MEESLYDGREQSRVKHLILKRYLLPFALIIGRSGWKSITYVDCFSGPWQSKSEQFEDTSFAIAVNQLREAKRQLAESGHKVEMRAFFLEKDKQAYAQLDKYSKEIQDIRVETLNSKLEDSVQEILNFIKSEDSQTFPFIFIDPTGWTGFALEVIRPLLQLKPCELLINFMTQHIIRFIDSEESQSSFQRLFGSSDFKAVLERVEKDDRVDKAVFEYRRCVSEAGDFQYTGIAGVMNPLKNRSHFHLIYLSRHPKGLQKFKDAEERSMREMEKARALAEQKHRQKKSKQTELSFTDDAPNSKYFESLRDRYRRMAMTDTESLMSANNRVRFDQVWKIWMQYPLVWEKDLKLWLSLQSEQIAVEGLDANQKVPKVGKNHWLKSIPPI